MHRADNSFPPAASPQLRKVMSILRSGGWRTEEHKSLLELVTLRPCPAMC